MSTAPSPPTDLAALREEVAAYPLWYHTMELGPGIVTRGWFDLRPIVERMPWPDVRGKRCLDIGTYDGFLAFELERRGAAEVLATDISDHASWDWPPEMRAYGPDGLASIAGPEKRGGFELARRALGSRVQRVDVSIYDLDPADLGRFDVIVCGSLLLHLRDPMRALEAVCSVCDGVFLSAEQIRVGLTLRAPRQPLATLVGVDDLCQWWVPNLAGHRRMLHVAGFGLERVVAPYVLPFGPAHPVPFGTGWARIAARRALLGGVGVPHSAALVRPRL